MVSPSDDPGTRAHKMCASCQAIATTRMSVIQAGKRARANASNCWLSMLPKDSRADFLMLIAIVENQLIQRFLVI